MILSEVSFSTIFAPLRLCSLIDISICLFYSLSLLIGVFSQSLEGRLYFIHVPKTGGTTLRLLLEMQLNEEEIYPYRNCETAKDPISEKLVSGHLPCWLCQNLDPQFQEAFKVTILRDPIERYLCGQKRRLTSNFLI